MRLNSNRGAFLLLLGAVHLIVGVTYIVPNPTPGVVDSLGIITQYGVPVWVAGIPWIPAAVIAWVSAFRRSGKDRLGFQALVSMDVIWTCGYIASWLLADYSRGYLLATLFAAIGGGVVAVAGMPNPGDVMDVHREHQ